MTEIICLLFNKTFVNIKSTDSYRFIIRYSYPYILLTLLNTYHKACRTGLFELRIVVLGNGLEINRSCFQAITDYQVILIKCVISIATEGQYNFICTTSKVHILKVYPLAIACEVCKAVIAYCYAF